MLLFNLAQGLKKFWLLREYPPQQFFLQTIFKPVPKGDVFLNF